MIRTTALTGALCVALAGVPAYADDAPKGNVMLAKTQPNVVLIWDATPQLVELLNAKKPSDDTLHALEADALAIMAERAKPATETVTIRVVYNRTSEVNKAYVSATLQGVEKLFTMAAPRAEVLKNAAAWKSQLAGGSTPKGVVLTVTGKLPGQ
ncbi:MAG TPA: hypothetical protein VE826_09545 [Dongiaceae bacterium]|nr:hypothetical protein [Dongiaceae bacterium]